MNSTERKEIQKNRMERYFIDSAKELIIKEGFEDLTTKKIGDTAGYSYATIYNYFKNFNELMCICIEEFSAEMSVFLEEKLEGIPSSKGKIRLLALESLNYIKANPNIYKLYLTDSIDYTYFMEKNSERFIHPVYIMLIEILSSIEEFKNYSQEEILSLGDLFFTLFHGKLHFYIMLKYPNSFEELEKDIMKNVDFLLKKIS